MKKLMKFLKKQDERARDNRAAHKLRIRNLSTSRKVAYWSTLTVGFATFCVGLVSQFVLTGMFVCYVLAVIIAPIISKSPNLKRNIFFAVLLCPQTVMAIFLVVFGLVSPQMYEGARIDQSIVNGARAEVAADAEEFHESFKKGDYKVIGVMSNEDSSLRHGLNDAFGYDLMKLTYGAMHLFAPRDVDTAAIMPLAQLSYADKVVVLSSQAVTDSMIDRQNARLEEKLGKDYAEAPLDVRADAVKGYSAISFLTCVVKNSGEVLLASGLPAAWTVDLRALPEAEPFIDVCSSVALMDLDELNELSELAKQQSKEGQDQK